MQSVVLLAIDDDPVQLAIIETAARSLEYPPIDVYTAETVAEAIIAIEQYRPDMVVCDFLLPDGSGSQVLDSVRSRNPFVPVIIITAYESVRDAVDLIRAGARDYLTKPLSASEIQRKIAVNLRWHQEETDYSAIIADDDALGTVVESLSTGMRDAIRTAVRAAPSEASVLIRGESGTGKELVARLIHDKSNRSGGPFVPVHLAALPESLIESELFGHRKGAFTGAQDDRIGLFENAQGGTLFIDEIGEIPPAVQVKLLRVLQFREIKRIGDNEPKHIDVRVLAATNRNLQDAMRTREFREDLFYRINVVEVNLPPLRDRREDIPRLVETKVREIAVRNGRSIPAVSPRAVSLLLAYDYPGNVRELENILERAVVLSHHVRITEEDLPVFVSAVPATHPKLSEPAEGATLDEQLHALEQKLIISALEATRGNQSRAASMLGITERRLRSRLERLHIENPFSPPAESSPSRASETREFDR